MVTRLILPYSAADDDEAEFDEDAPKSVST
jgi:hypothetical protein